MASETVTAIVLSSQNIGETDRRIVLLTRERGKISAFARGAVKPKNPLVTASQPFTFGEFFLYAGRDSYTVTGAEVKNHFPGIIKDLDMYYYASYLCEVADYYTRENLYAGDVLLLLYQSLKALEKKTIEFELIRYIYEWRMLLINGEVPDVFGCMECGGRTSDGIKLVHFLPQKHGMICEKCAAGSGEYKQSEVLLSSTIYTLQFIIATPLEKLYTFRVTDEVLAQLRRITDEYLDIHRKYHFNSADFLELDKYVKI